MTATATGLSPDEGMTAGSLSIQQSGAALREVCAEARDLYLVHRRGEARSAQGGPGRRRRPDHRPRRLGDQLLGAGRRDGAGPAGQRWRQTETGIGLPRRRHRRGTNRPAGQARSGGRATCTICSSTAWCTAGWCVRRRGARRSPQLDTGPTLALPGVVTVVRDGDFLGVIAEREEVALRAADRLRADATWDQKPSLPDEDDLPAFLTEAPADTTVLADGSTSADDGAPVVVGDLPSAVHRARVDRTVLRGRAGTRRTSCRSGRTARACTTCAGRSRASWECAPSNWWSATSRAPGATATTAPTTPPWTRPCSRWPCRAGRCRWCGRAPTNWRGRRWEPPAWSGSRPTPRTTARCRPGGTRSGAAPSSAAPA